MLIASAILIAESRCGLYQYHRVFLPPSTGSAVSSSTQSSTDTPQTGGDSAAPSDTGAYKHHSTFRYTTRAGMMNGTAPPAEDRAVR